MLIENFNYFIAILIMIIGCSAIVIHNNLFKKLFALGIFQSATLLFYISMSKIKSGVVPLLECLDFNKCPTLYVNPLPHVLMLTAIVVGVATLAVGLAIVVKIQNTHDTVDERALINFKISSKKLK